MSTDMSAAMLHERLSIHSVCFPGAGIEELFVHWKAVGAKRVSFSSRQVIDFGAERVRALLDDDGLHAETMTHVMRIGALTGVAADVEADRAQLREAIAAAGTIGARSIYMLTGGRGRLHWEAAAQVFADTIAPCRAEAADAGVALAVENASPLFADLHIGNNLRDTIALAERADIGVCVDVWGCWTEAGLPSLIERAMPRCRVIQLSDYVYGDRALPCRAVPGDGAIPLRDIVAHALKLGYAGAFDLELIGPRIDSEGQREAVVRAGRAVAAMLQELGA